MATQIIERADWATFFESLSQRRQGDLLELDLVGPESGVQPEARRQGSRPLHFCALRALA